MSALVKFNDRNHVETTVLPTYHFQDALPSLVKFSISYYEFSLLILEILESRIRLPTVKLKIPGKSRIQTLDPIRSNNCTVINMDTHKILFLKAEKMP